MRHISHGFLLACAGAAMAADEPPTVPPTDANQARTLERVVVTGGRPSTLPLEIPTTTEGITGAQIERSINATDASDALKYFPSLVVRKRNIGDYDHAVLASRASGTGNSARSLVFADGILLSNLLGNGAEFTPRWGLVSPDEIERVDVLYGPFSAAYSGNSAGAIVDYVTRMPTRFEAHIKVQAHTQKYQLYQTDERYSGHQESASIGSRAGAFSWWIHLNRQDSDGQPLVIARVNQSSTPSAAGTPVTGAVADRNHLAVPVYNVGTSAQTRSVQDSGKLKLAYDLTPTLRASYTLGFWRNDARRSADSFLRDGSGNPVYGGQVNIGGSVYTMPALTPSRAELQHLAHGPELRVAQSGRFAQRRRPRLLFDLAAVCIPSQGGGLVLQAAAGDGQRVPVQREAVATHATGHQALAEAVAGFHQHLPPVAADGVQREAHARHIGWHHGLHHHRHGRGARCLARLAIGQRRWLQQRRPAGLDPVQQLGLAAHTQEGLVLARKGMVGMVLVDRR